MNGFLEIPKNLRVSEPKGFFQGATRWALFLFFEIYIGEFKETSTQLDSMIHATPLLATITIGGFNGIAAAFGILALVQVSQFIYYGLDANDPSNG